jgi:hypothetical protein
MVSPERLRRELQPVSAGREFQSMFPRPCRVSPVYFPPSLPYGGIIAEALEKGKRTLKKNIKNVYQFSDHVFTGLPENLMSNLRLGMIRVSALCNRNVNCHPLSRIISTHASLS